ncbi:MAG: diacylglycerol kinase family lipid kinase [Clostridia bacterium]|nr:diacylglycerol kinase family lipid kinase [Clostridia bacterium]
MAKKKLLLIFNPSSGKSAIRQELWNVVNILVKGGYDVTVYPTQRKLDCRDQVRERAAEFDVICICGGDGTLSEAIQGLADIPLDKCATLGYIPCGSTNDFGSSLEIPFEIPLAAERLCTGKPMLCDCGRFNGNPYLYISAFGMFTDVSYETPQRMKNQLGHAAYIIEAIRRLNNYSYSHIKVESEEINIEDDFVVGFVSNTTSIGGMKNRFEYEPLLNDGLLECIMIKNPVLPSDYQAILSAIVAQDLDCPNIVKFTTRKVTLTSSEPIKWTTDGEDGGSHTKTVIEVIPDAYRIIV